MQVSELPVHHKIISRLLEKGFETLTEIQIKTLLPALKGQDVVASSKTGSGKTLAFVVPMIHRLLTAKPLSRQDPRVLVLAPTRELAKQVFGEIKSLTSKMQLQSMLIVGGENFNDQAKALRRNPHIIVGTAGRIADHLNDKAFFLNGLELLIFDEADRMLDLGFASALNQINQFADHRKRQTMMFSATLDSLGVNHLAKSLLKSPIRVTVGDATEQHEDIQQTLYFADNVSHKDEMLNQCLKELSYDQAIVFTATRDDTDRLTQLLNEQQLQAIALRGDLPQNQRAAIMSAFSRGQHSVLVTTDVASRGLDLLKVELVVNFDLPNQADEYIHRIGRTGRAGRKGTAISFVGPRDWKNYQAIAENVSYPVAPQAHPSLPASFTGVKPKPKKRPAKQDAKNLAETKNAGPESPKVKRVNTMQGKDAGDMPIIRRKTPLADDEEE